MKLLQSTARLLATSSPLSAGNRLLLQGRQWVSTTTTRQRCLAFPYTNTGVLFMSTTTATTDDPPQQFIKSYKLKGETSATSNKSGVTVHTDTGHVLQTDVPRKMGGRDTAPQPVETLLTAWMGCTQATALFVGRQMKPNRLLIDRLVFDVQGHRDERGALTLPVEQQAPVPSRLYRVQGTITVHRVGGQAITDQEMEILREQTELRCPVANMMIASGCQMNVEWIDGAASC